MKAGSLIVVKAYWSPEPPGPAGWIANTTGVGERTPFMILQLHAPRNRGWTTYLTDKGLLWIKDAAVMYT